MSRSRSKNKLRSWESVAKIMNARSDAVGEVLGIARREREHYSDEKVRRIGKAALTKMRDALRDKGIDEDIYDIWCRMLDSDYNV